MKITSPFDNSSLCYVYTNQKYTGMVNPTTGLQGLFWLLFNHSLLEKDIPREFERRQAILKIFKYIKESTLE